MTVVPECECGYESDRRAVTPVIGVVLLIRLTIVLSVSIATVAMGIVQESQPTETQPWNDETPDAAFDIDRSADLVILTHDGGGSIDTDDLEIRGDLADAPATFDGETVASGDRAIVDLDPDVDRGSARVGVVWSTAYHEDTIDREVV